MREWVRPAALARVAAALASGLLLAAAFPPLEWSDAALAALVPLLLAARYSAPRTAFKLGFLAGTVFWLFSLYWLTRVTVPGWLGLSLYCALYVGAFAGVTAWWLRARGTERTVSNITFVLGIPFVWVGFEYLRSTLFTGFAWNGLGVSQAGNPARVPLIQIAEWGGVYAVSAVVVMMNAGAAFTVLRLVRYFRARSGLLEQAADEVLKTSRRQVRQVAPPRVSVGTPLLPAEFLVAALLALSIGFSGMRRCLRPAETGPELRIAAVQPNIPQDLKWSQARADENLQRLAQYSEMVMGTQPDLIVWPETATPEFVQLDGASRDVVQRLLTNGIPLLVGSLDYRHRPDGGIDYFNSSLLFEPGGGLAGKYDKQHLVIFGEYVPLERLLPFLRALTPIEGNISPGRARTVFALNGVRFSVLICFEDVFPRLSREFVRAGARLLVNQTNDAWFHAAGAPRQHMNHCVLRCVENRVPTVRVTNTGITCFIGPAGRVLRALAAEAPGTIVHGLPAASSDMPLTFYTRNGDVFAVVCTVFTALLGLWMILRLTRTRSLR